jgi:hypothetical protein
MYRWHLALESGAILPQEERAKLVKPYVPQEEGSKSSYAYGWSVTPTQRKTRLVSHNGGNGIFEADFRRYVDEGTVIFIASNAEISGIAVGGRVARLLFGAEVTLPPRVASLSVKTLQRYAGTYRIDGNHTFEVRRNDARLDLLPDGQAALHALFCADDATRRAAEARNRRSALLVEAARKGDYAPLQKAMGGDATLEQLREQGSAFWNDSRERLGEFKKLEIMGTRPGPRGGDRTTLRLDFERGSAYLVYTWAGDALVDVRPMDHPPMVGVFPISSTEFTPFDVESDPAFRVSFQVKGDESVSGMEIGGAICLVHARRL